MGTFYLLYIQGHIQIPNWHFAATLCLNTLRPRQDGRHFTDDIFKSIFLNENVWFLNKISLKFVPKSLINNIPALVQIMAWRRLGDKPLFEPMMFSLPTHICVTRPQWVNTNQNMGVCTQTKLKSVTLHGTERSSVITLTYILNYI